MKNKRLLAAAILAGSFSSIARSPKNDCLIP